MDNNKNMTLEQNNFNSDMDSLEKNNTEKKISDGRKLARIGRILLLVSVAILVIVIVLSAAIIGHAKANGDPLDDSSGLGWVIGFFIFIPGIGLHGNLFVVGLILSIIAEVQYKKYLKSFPVSVSKKIKIGHILSLSCIVVVIVFWAIIASLIIR